MQDKISPCLSEFFARPQDPAHSAGIQPIHITHIQEHLLGVGLRAEIIPKDISERGNLLLGDSATELNMGHIRFYTSQHNFHRDSRLREGHHLWLSI